MFGRRLATHSRVLTHTHIHTVLICCPVTASGLCLCHNPLFSALLVVTVLGGASCDGFHSLLPCYSPESRASAAIFRSSLFFQLCSCSGCALGADCMPCFSMLNRCLRTSSAFGQASCTPCRTLCLHSAPSATATAWHACTCHVYEL